MRILDLILAALLSVGVAYSGVSLYDYYDPSFSVLGRAVFFSVGSVCLLIVGAAIGIGSKQ